MVTFYFFTTYINWMSSQIDEKKNKKIVNARDTEGNDDANAMFDFSDISVKPQRMSREEIIAAAEAEAFQ